MDKTRKRAGLMVLLVMEVIMLCMAAGKCLFSERFEAIYEDGMACNDAMIAVPKGYYRIIVNYATDADGIFCRMSAGTSHGMHYGEEVPLIKEKNQKEIEFELPESTENFAVKINSSLEEFPGIYISSVSIQETRRMDLKNGFLLFLFFVLLDAFLLIRWKGSWKRMETERRQTVLALAGVCVFASVPLFVNYTIGEQDLSFHLMRIEGIVEGLRAGEFPVKMQSNWLNGYGYPVSVMYGDILLYLPAALRLMGFSLQDAYKIYLFLINAATVGIACYCVKGMTGSRKMGMFAAWLYGMSFYRIVNLYYRSAVGEYSAMAFLPLAFFGLHLVLKGREEERKKGIACMMAGYTLVLQSHLLSFEMLIIFSVLYVLVRFRELKKNLKCLVGTALVTIGLNLGFLVPLLDYMLTQQLKIKETSYADIMQEQGIFITQLFQTFSFRGKHSNAVSEGIAADMPLGIGVALVMVLLLFLWECLVYRSVLKEKLGGVRWREQCIAGLMMALSMLMSCWFFPWSVIGKLPVVGSAVTSFQFAWRFLMIASWMGVLLAGYVFSDFRLLEKAEIGKLAAFAVGIMTLLGGVYLMDRQMSDTQVKIFTGTASINSVEAVIGGEYLPENADKAETHESQVYAGETVEITAVQRAKDGYVVCCKNVSDGESWVRVPLFAYKGYTAVDIGSKAELSVTATESDILKVLLPAGYEGELKVYFKQPFIWRAAEVFSLLICVLVLYWWRKGQECSKKSVQM